jgi:hypothetical protein
MRKASEREEFEERIQGGEVKLKLTEGGVEWERIWGRRTGGNAVPPALEELR